MSGTRTYQAYTMAEALAAVKYDLGAEAIILSTRTFKRGGLLGLGRRTVVEVTASAERPIPAMPARPGTIVERAYGKDQKTRKNSPSGKPPLSPDRSAAVQALASEADRQRTRRLAMVMQERHRRDNRVEPVAARAAAARASTVADATAVQSATGGTSTAVMAAAPVPAAAASANGLVVTVPSSPMAVAARRFILRTPQQSSDEASDSPPEILTTGPTARTTVQTTPASIVSIGAPPAPAPAYSAYVRTPTALRGGAVDMDSQVQSELAAIKHMVGQVLQRQSTGPRNTAGALPPKVFDAYLRLIGHDFPDELAESIVMEMRDRLSPDELADDSALHEATVTFLADRIPVATTPLAQTSLDHRPLTIALIGPTGVGKTTTLAKLAASFKLKAGRRVGLITSDTYRIAAVDQLRTYANIIGLPLQVVMTPSDMRQAMDALSDQEVILIDTAGRSQNDVMRVAELRELIDAAQPHQTHMVLSGTANAKVLTREAEAFGRVGVDRLILTKLDEAASLGAVMGLLQHIGKPVSFVTTGQEVPNDLEMAQARRLAEIALGGSLRP